MDKDIGIYIHIPFCKSKCHYCNFFSSSNKDGLIPEYIDAVCKEIIDNTEILSQRNITSIYFGGGTPSYIPSIYVKQVLDILNLFLDKDKNIEVTLEVNPGTITKEKLQEYKNSGINRLSIGLQSTFDDILKSIGRIHNLKDFKDTLKMAHEIGFENISVDLMYPLPNLTLAKLQSTLEYVVSLENIKHISIYNLEIHEGSKLDFLIKEGYLEMADEEEEYKMHEYINEFLETKGFKQYEISNYAKDGYTSKHNLNYWNQGEYIGVGSGASSFIDGTRYKNIEDIEKYILNINSNSTVIKEKEQLDKLDLMKEYVILNLRKTSGIVINNFFSKFDTNIFEIFGIELKELKEKELIDINEKNIHLTKRGKEVANIVWQEFI